MTLTLDHIEYGRLWSTLTSDNLNMKHRVLDTDLRQYKVWLDWTLVTVTLEDFDLG